MYNFFSESYDDGVPLGPICTLIPEKYHRFIDHGTLKAYLASNQKDANTFINEVGAADIPVISHQRSTTIYPLLQVSLTEGGEEAVREINNPWLINTLVDLVPSFEEFLSKKPLQHNGKTNSILLKNSYKIITYLYINSVVLVYNSI